MTFNMSWTYWVCFRNNRVAPNLIHGQSSCFLLEHIKKYHFWSLRSSNFNPYPSIHLYTLYIHPDIHPKHDLAAPQEHTSPLFAATVHGAYQSGQRAALDIINGMPSASALSASKHVPLALLFVMAVANAPGWPYQTMFWQWKHTHTHIYIYTYIHVYCICLYMYIYIYTRKNYVYT